MRPPQTKLPPLSEGLYPPFLSLPSLIPEATLLAFALTLYMFFGFFSACSSVNSSPFIHFQYPISVLVSTCHKFFGSAIFRSRERTRQGMNKTLQYPSAAIPSILSKCFTFLVTMTLHPCVNAIAATIPSSESIAIPFLTSSPSFAPAFIAEA